MIKSGSFINILPAIALYTFAGYRLMPAFHQIYGSVTQLRYSGPAIDALYSELINLKLEDKRISNDSFSINNEISLNNIKYCYPDSKSIALENLNLRISARSTVGIVGVSGSGKTTVVDLILGLLEPQEGSLKVDGKVVTRHNKYALQRVIGYVPQQIYLSDDSVAANIAFGVDIDNIDLLAVERAAKIANLHEFIPNELPLQYQTNVGDRGVRLSGGSVSALELLARFTINLSC